MLSSVAKIFLCMLALMTMPSCYSLKITNNRSVYCKYIGKELETTDRLFVVERGGECFLEIENQWLSHKYNFNDFESGKKYPVPFSRIVGTIKKGSVIRIDSVVTKYWIAFVYPYDSNDALRAKFIKVDCDECRNKLISLQSTDLPGEFGYFPPSPGCDGIPIRFVETARHGKEPDSKNEK